MIEVGIVQAVKEVKRRNRTSQYRCPTSPVNFGRGAGHQPGHLFAPDLDKVDGALGLWESANQSVDAITGTAENALDTPGAQTAPRRNPKSATVMAGGLPS